MKALFLDRDGVINVENPNGYILRQEDFEFMPRVPEALNLLTAHFDLMLIVTNQRCVGRKLISTEALEAMHTWMVETLAQSAVHIEKVYYAPALETDNFFRKPNPGMGLKALEDFPKIEVNKSYMVGNNLSDMEFGRKLGLHNVFLHTTSPAFDILPEIVDEQHAGLWEFAQRFIARES